MIVIITEEERMAIIKGGRKGKMILRSEEEGMIVRITEEERIAIIKLIGITSEKSKRGELSDAEKSLWEKIVAKKPLLL